MHIGMCLTFSRWNLFKALRHEECGAKSFNDALPQVCPHVARWLPMCSGHERGPAKPCPYQVPLNMAYSGEECGLHPVHFPEVLESCLEDWGCYVISETPTND